MPYRTEYAEVPDVEPGSEPDPHWQDLQLRTSMVPGAYLPPSTGGQQTGWRKVAAWTLIGLLVTATAGGVCLTYGPDEIFRLLGS